MDYSKYNKVKKFVNEFDTNAVYIKLSEYFKLYNEGGFKDTNILNMYTTNGIYGERAIVSVKGYHVNLPAHQVSIVKDLLNNQECINDINDGKLHLIPYSYTREDNIYYSVNWICED